MSLEQRLTQHLENFEEKTEGILGSCVVASKSALMMAEASHAYDRDVIQAMSERLISLGNDTLNFLIENATLQSVTIEEADHMLYVRKIDEEYHLVVLTDKSETMGLREMNVRELISRIRSVFVN